MDVSTKLKELRKKAGLTQQEVADKVDVSRVAVGQWESGSVTPRPNKIERLAELFGVSVAQLLGYDFDSLPRGAMPITSSEEAMVPMLELGSIHAGDPKEAIEDAVLVQVPADVARYHRSGYLLRVEGGCMDRVYPEGCRVLVDPAMEPRPGSAVAAQVDGGDVVMRRYYRGRDTLMLVSDSLSGDYEDIVFKGGMGDVRLLGVICWFQAEHDERG